MAKLLVNYYGGKFADAFPWFQDTEAIGIGQAYYTWASQNFGLYSTALGFEAHRRVNFDRETMIVLNGGGSASETTIFRSPTSSTRVS